MVPTHEIVYSAVAAVPATVPVPQWWLYSGSHILEGSLLVIDNSSVEAHIQLDGQPLYRSRHRSRSIAEQELSALRRQYAGDGWFENV